MRLFQSTRPRGARLRKSEVAYLGILEQACEGIEFLRKSRPGTGPAAERKANRERGYKLLKPFYETKAPKRFEARRSELLDIICNYI